ncbi:hypothetical protein P7C73_g2281, partial [Tremellales sp. Uapishka_1]
MAKQKAGKKSLQDWSWVGSEVKSVDQITRLHQLRAAGLHGGNQCPVNLSTFVDLTSKDGEASEDEIQITKDTRCTAKRCKSSPWCYNHLGAEQVIAKGAKDQFLEQQLGEEVQVRVGPAGLRNFGATCYANAFLQIWFHNIAFRNGVYACRSSEDKPLFHLALVFASLQYTEKQIVDPTGLVEVLKLNKSDQQDAAEFSKLFISSIEHEFKRQQEPTLKSFIQDQFEGRLRYVTKCEKCHYRSEKENTWLELVIDLKDNTTLKDRIKAFLGTEILDGDNKYFCPRCQKLERATRFAEIISLPPVINFALNRFVYDLSSLTRKKSKASITYPKELVLPGREDVYELRGVVTHGGTSFMARSESGWCRVERTDLTYNRDKEWYDCNDEEITKLSERPKKRLKLANPEFQASRDAYMLVYKRKGENTVPTQPPDSVMERVKEDNAIFNAELDHRALKKENVVDKQVDHVVPRDALSTWLKADTFADLSTPFKFDDLVCDHGGIDPGKTSEARMISSRAFELLREHSEVQDLSVCDICVENGFDARSRTTEFDEVVKNFDRLNKPRDVTRAEYFVPRLWLSHWRLGKFVEMDPKPLPTDEVYSLLCEHGKLSSGNGTTSVTEEAAALLQSVMGDFPLIKGDAETCEICEENNKEEDQNRSAWLVQVKKEKQILKHMDKFGVFLTDNYWLPKKFYREWQRWLKENIPRPDLEMEFCPHDKLDFDPSVDEAHYLDETGWQILTGYYGTPAHAVIVQFGSRVSVRNLAPIQSCNTETCFDCRQARLLDFDETTAKIVFDKDQDKATTSRRTRAYKQLSLDVTKSTKIVDLKVEIYQASGVSPLSQKIFYKDHELDSGDTIGSIGFLKGDSLRMTEVLEVGDFEDDGVPGGEGFGGTALGYSPDARKYRSSTRKERSRPDGFRSFP